MTVELVHGDCLSEMDKIATGSIDAIIADWPYGTTACKWDTVIPFKPLWAQCKRVIKPRGAVVLFGSQPFTSALVMSNLKWFKYEWVWEKTKATNFMLIHSQPFKKHENIVVFSKAGHVYNPQMEKGKPYVYKERDAPRTEKTGAWGFKKHAILNEGTRYPSTVQKFSNGNNGSVHPTQKPVPLLEYLIRTYTNEGETVLDNTMGSGTCGVAC